MTRFVVEPNAMIHVVADGIDIGSGHELLAPTLLRSQTLSMVHEAVDRGELSRDVGRRRLAEIGRRKIRYLGDAVLRRRAWDLAEQLGVGPTYHMEYLALTQLQGDALLTLDESLARLADGLVRLATIEELG